MKLIAIKSCNADRLRGCHDAIRDSWGFHARNHTVGFFMGEDATLTKGDEVRLDAPDDYDNLPYKTREICRWALSNGYESVFLCDNDTFVHPIRLDGANLERWDYYGRFYWYSRTAWAIGGPFRFAFGGTGYHLSKKAMRIVADATITMKNEDEWVGSVLASFDLRRGEGNYDRFERYVAWHYTKNLYPAFPKYDPASGWQDMMEFHHLVGAPQKGLAKLDRVTFPFPHPKISLPKTNPAVVQALLSKLEDTAQSSEPLISLAAIIEIEKKPVENITTLEWDAAQTAYNLLGHYGLAQRCGEYGSHSLA